MLLFAESFSIYGTGSTGAANLAQVDKWLNFSSASPQTSPVRGLGTHCARAGALGGSDQDTMRFSLGGDVQELICGAAFRCESLPSGNDRNALFQFRDSANANQLTLFVTSTGTLRLARGGINSTDNIAETASPVFISGAYQFVEMYARIDNAGSPGGAAEIRVDGVPVIVVTGVDTQATAIASVAQVNVARARTSGGVEMNVMDLYALDTSGPVNNDFLGDTQWIPIFPNDDTAASDWVRNTGSSDFSAINNNPQDGDTTYLDANNVNDVSEFGMANLPGGIGEVVGIVSRAVMRKTSPGDGSAQVSLVSALASPETEVSGTDRPLTEVYVSYSDIFETDPETGARWLPAAVDALRLKLERTL